MHSYAVNNDRLRCYVIIGVICALLAPVTYEMLKKATFLSSLEPWVSTSLSFGTLYAITFAFYNRVAWKWSFLKFIGLPLTANLNGSYEGKLISSYKRTEVSITIDIVQSWTKLVVYLETGTDSSDSYSYMASIFDIDGKSSRLSYSYTNTPFNVIAASDMHTHDGTVNLVFRNNNQKIMGKYFNARQRVGTITLKKKNKL